MNKDTLINLRTSKALKDDFQSIVEREGFTMSEVLEASMLDIVHRNIVPINIRSKIRKENTDAPPPCIPQFERSQQGQHRKGKCHRS